MVTWHVVVLAMMVLLRPCACIWLLQQAGERLIIQHENFRGCTGSGSKRSSGSLKVLMHPRLLSQHKCCRIHFFDL